MTAPANVPPLAAGDRLSRDEFERRYAAMPHLKKAELIEGVVYMPSPVRLAAHGEPHSLLAGWLVAYCARTPGTGTGTEATLRLDQDNEPQPDLLLRVATSAGTSRVDADDYLQGAPELVVEIAATSVSYDLHQKLEVYRRNGVREYLVYRPTEAAVDWFHMREGRYHPIAPGSDGVLRSLVFPGLWLEVRALLRSNAAALLAAVAAGTATAEHASFCLRLQGP
jgi:Uma2 family endonuclease